MSRGITGMDSGTRYMGRLVTLIFSGIILMGFVSCSTVIRRDLSENNGEITVRELWNLHRDVRYTKFIYSDSTVKEGLLLRWKPDSIMVQPRKRSSPVWIPSEGITAIQIETGNRMPEWVAGSVLAAGVYVVFLKSWELTSASQTEGVAKLLGPPLIVFSAMGIGSGINKYQEYKIPAGFKFDFDKENQFFEILE